MSIHGYDLIQDVMKGFDFANTEVREINLSCIIQGQINKNLHLEFEIKKTFPIRIKMDI